VRGGVPGCETGGTATRAQVEMTGMRVPTAEMAKETQAFTDLEQTTKGWCE
jgi:hypothetical protein